MQLFLVHAACEMRYIDDLLHFCLTVGENTMLTDVY